MSNFEVQHIFGIEKEENGIIFASCLIHNPPEYLIGKRKDDVVEQIYTGTDKYQAEKIYLDLISK